MEKKTTTGKQTKADNQIVTPEPPQVMNPSKPPKKQTKDHKSKK